MQKLLKYIIPGSVFAGFFAFLLVVIDLFAYKYKSPIAGYFEGWLFILIEVFTVIILAKYYFVKLSIRQISKKQTFGIGMVISSCFSLSWAIFSFLFIKFIYPNYETEMINYLYHPSPFASAAESSGMYLMAQLSANAYTNSIFKIISGLLIGIIVTTVMVFINNRQNNIAT